MSVFFKFISCNYLFFSLVKNVIYMEVLHRPTLLLKKANYTFENAAVQCPFFLNLFSPVLCVVKQIVFHSSTNNLFTKQALCTIHEVNTTVLFQRIFILLS